MVITCGKSAICIVLLVFEARKNGGYQPLAGFRCPRRAGWAIISASFVAVLYHFNEVSEVGLARGHPPTKEATEPYR